MNRSSTNPDAPPNTPRQSATPTARCEIESFTLGPFETNCYLVYPQGTGPGRDCWIIDASVGPSPLIDRVKTLALKPKAILLTHAHLDHIAGVNEVLDAFPGTPVLIHAAEKEWLSNPVLNLSAGGGMNITARGPDGFLAEGEDLELPGSRWKVFHTPGHSPGSVSLWNSAQNAAIVGDALFAGSVGRTDFPGCDQDTLFRSIRTKLYTLPDETVIFPGHGPQSTIGREKRSNPFVRP